MSYHATGPGNEGFGKVSEMCWAGAARHGRSRRPAVTVETVTGRNDVARPQAMAQAVLLTVKAVGFGLLPLCVPLKPKLTDAPGAIAPL